MADDGPVYSLTIERMLHGGYLVTDAYRGDIGNLRALRFASTTVDEALGYIRDKIKPVSTNK